MLTQGHDNKERLLSASWHDRIEHFAGIKIMTPKIYPKFK